MKRRVAALLALGLLGGCDTATGTGALTLSPGSAPLSSAPAPLVTASPVVSDPVRASPSPVPTGSAPDLVDETLLERLPPEVDGLTLDRSPESDAIAAADPVVIANATGVATAVAVDAGSGDFVHATLVRLRSGVFDDVFFRAWRDTFNVGACSQAGGLVGTAQAEIGGRLVHLTTCAGGVHVYHAWIGNTGVLVSVTALGDRRLGERLMEALRE